MSGEGQYREQGKKTVEKTRCGRSQNHKRPNSSRQRQNNMAGKHRTKVYRKERSKIDKVAFDTKSKKYMLTYEEKEEVLAEEVIRLDIPDAHIYFCFHPTKNEYVVIDAPNRQEPDAKYIITAPLFHWI